MERSNGWRRIFRSAPVAALFALSLASLGYAAEDPRDLATAPPGAVGLDAEALERLGAAMRRLVADGDLAGGVTAVARRGKLVQFDAFGEQDAAAGVPMAKDTIFRIYSMTKPVAGVALMTFYDEGRFALDDPLSKFIPEFKGLKVAAGETDDGEPVLEDADHEMTIRELASHTAGLTYGFFSRSPVDTLYQRADVLDRDSTLAEMIDKLAAIPLRQQPGTQWHYSVAVDVQGRLVELLAGKPFDQVLEERVFQPLGMKDTGFWVPEASRPRFATLYRQTRGGELRALPFGEYLQAPRLLSGGGGLVSTAMDYLRFCQMLLNGGELDGARVLRPETVALMLDNQLPEGHGFIDPRVATPGNVFGIDFAIVEEPDGATDHPLAKGEAWWYGIGGTWFGINPSQHLAIVGMIQNMGGAGARRARLQSKRIVYDAILDAPPP